MDFAFSAEQESLGDAIRKLGVDRFGENVARSWLAGDSGPVGRGWDALTETGLTGLLVAEDLGGSGASLVEGCFVSEELAASLAPVPYVGTAIAAVTVLQSVEHPDAEDLQRRIVGGEQYGIALDRHLHWPPAETFVGLWGTPGRLRGGPLG
jgi:alkylation response protein AidB-like acyl-CoA dehydrogenase